MFKTIQFAVVRAVLHVQSAGAQWARDAGTGGQCVRDAGMRGESVRDTSLAVFVIVKYNSARHLVKYNAGHHMDSSSRSTTIVIDVVFVTNVTLENGTLFFGVEGI